MAALGAGACPPWRLSRTQPGCSGCEHPADMVLWLTRSCSKSVGTEGTGPTPGSGGSAQHLLSAAAPAGAAGAGRWGPRVAGRAQWARPVFSPDAPGSPLRKTPTYPHFTGGRLRPERSRNFPCSESDGAGEEHLPTDATALLVEAGLALQAGTHRDLCRGHHTREPVPSPLPAPCSAQPDSWCCWGGRDGEARHWSEKEG